MLTFCSCLTSDSGVLVAYFVGCVRPSVAWVTLQVWNRRGEMVLLTFVPTAEHTIMVDRRLVLVCSRSDRFRQKGLPAIVHD